MRETLDESIRDARHRDVGSVLRVPRIASISARRIIPPYFPLYRAFSPSEETSHRIEEKIAGAVN